MQLPASVWSTLKSLHINSSTHRGRRAGVRQQRRRAYAANNCRPGHPDDCYTPVFNHPREQDHGVAQPITVINQPRVNNDAVLKPRTGPNNDNLITIKCVSNFNETPLDMYLWNAHSVSNKTDILCD